MTRLSKAPASYGVSYLGSKNKIAAEVVYNIPSAPLLIDVFAGGGAITHAALLSHRFSSILANDYDCGALQLFYRASHGLIDFEEERKRWVSREDFKRLKDTDPIVRYHWSFSNNGRDYLFSKEIEPYKRAYHFARNCNDRTEWNAIGFEKFEPTRLSIRDHAEEIKDIYIRWWLKHNCYEGDIEALIANLSQDIERQSEELRQWLCEALTDAGITQAEVGRRLNTQMQRHYFGKSQWEFPTKEAYDQMRTFMPKLDKEYEEVVGLYKLRKSLESLQSLQSLESLESLQSLQRRQRLQRLQRLQSLQSLESLKSLQRLQSLKSLQRLQSLKSLQRLQNIQSLQRLQNIQSLTISKADYKDIFVSEPTTVIYCDPPYINTSGYEDAIRESGFNHAEFYDWCEAQKGLVVLSEYTAPADRFTCVWSKEKRVLSAGAKHQSTKVERLFVVKGHEDDYWDLMAAHKPSTLFDQDQRQAMI